MTGEELRTKAINGAKGLYAWGKLSAAEKGMWNNAVREIQHEKDKLLVQVTLHERKAIVYYLRNGLRLFDAADAVEWGNHWKPHM